MRISVVAHPNSKKPCLPAGKARVEKDLSRTLHVYVNKPPLEGKANKAVIEALAKYFNVKKSDVILISGSRSKNKIFEINI